MELYKIKSEQQNGRIIPSPAMVNNTLEISTNIENATNEHFMSANTSSITLQEIKDKHVIPVFVKDNVPAISQVEFIESTMRIAQTTLKQSLANLSIRVSHPIKGRTFEARSKKVSDLLEHEKTIYNERMAFIFEIPHFKENVHGQMVSLTVAGVKAYNQDNLYSYSGSVQRFKIGIGYKVQVCTNLCLFTDGTQLEVKARSVEELELAIIEMFQKESFQALLPQIHTLGEYSLSEKQFATLLGKARLYNYLPQEQKVNIPPLLISDRQISTVAKQYYSDDNFMKNPDGSISLWNMYNLFTDSVKTSYIDTFLDRNVNAFSFIQGIASALEQKGNHHWFLS
ncbi:MAG: DUF3871 family protein [Chitinophagales bacterium]